MTEQERMLDLRWTPATAWEAEGARVGIVSCSLCGAAVLLERDNNNLDVHEAWHRRMEVTP